MDNTPSYPAKLKYRVFENESGTDQTDCLFVLCHGYGAPGSDLVPIAEELLQSVSNPQIETDDSSQPSPPKVRVVVPEAPLQLEEIPGYDARAWWNLNMQKLQEAIGSGDLTMLARSKPPGIEEANRLLNDLISEQTKELGLPLSRVVLAGFSQGAMLSTDVALRLPERIGGLAILSGTTVCQEEWESLAKAKAGLPVFQTHGNIDPVLPIEGAKLLANILTQAGLEVRFGEFHGPHTIPMPAVDELAKMVLNVAKGSEPAEG